MADDFENEPLAVDAEDGGVIRCICGFPEDDGSTIQCDVCDVWQHFLCIDIDENNVPDEYLCDECSPRELDGDLARQRQSRRSHAEQHLRNAYAAPLPSDFEIQIKAAARTYALSEVQLDIQSLLLQEPDPPQQQQSEPFPPSNAGADRTRSQPASVAASNSRKRAAPSLNSSSSSGAGALSSGAGSASHAQPHSLEQQQQYSGPLPPVKKKRKSRQSAAGQHVAPVPAQTPTTPGLEAAQNVSASNSNNNNARRSNQVQSLPGVGAPDDEDWQESWIYEYTNIQQSIWDDLDAVEHVRVGLQSWFAHIGQPCHVHVRRIKNRPGTLPTHRLQWTRTPVPEAGSGFFAGYVEEEDFGLCAPLGPRYMNESKQQINACASRMAVKNVPSASFSLAPPLSTPFTPGNTFTAPTIACPYPRPVGQALYAKTSCAAGHFIAPFYGSVVARASYLSAPSNQYDVLGVPKPGVRALPLPWSVMIDARHFGNEVRFARSGCVPNAVVRPIIHSTFHISSMEEGFEVDFGLHAARDITKKEEIVVAWDWDDDHLIHLLPRLLFEPQVRSSIPLPIYSQQLAAVTSTLLPLSPCACSKRKSCALSWMYRLACCSQPASLGSTKSRDHLDASLVEDKIQGLLVGGGRGGKKGVDLDSINYRRGWEVETKHEQVKQEVDVSEANSDPAQVAEMDDFDKMSQGSVDSDATEPLSRAEDVAEAKQVPDIMSRPSESPGNVTASAQPVEEAKPPMNIEREPSPPAVQPDDTAASMGFEGQQYDSHSPSALQRHSEADAKSAAPSPAANSPATAATQPSPEPEPEVEPSRPKTPSPPPIPKAKVSFAAFMKRWKDKPEPNKAPSPEPTAPEVNVDQTKADMPGLTSPGVHIPSSEREFAENSLARATPHAHPIAKSEAGEDGPVHRPNSPVYRPVSPVYRPNSPLYRPNSPIYRPSSPPISARLPPPSPTSAGALPTSYRSPPQRTNAALASEVNTLQAQVSSSQQAPSHSDKSTYFPSTSSFHYEPTLRSSELRSPSPRLPASATSSTGRAKPRSPSPPSSSLADDRWHSDRPQGSPPSGPRYSASSHYGRWAPRGRGRGYAPSSGASSSGYHPHYGSGSGRDPPPPHRPSGPPPPRAPRALQAGPGPSARPSMWSSSSSSSQASRIGPNAGSSGFDRGPYRGVPRGPRGGFWRGRGRGM